MYKRQTHGMSAGAYFIGELNFQVIILNTVEQVYQQGVQYFPQRVRWSASGLPYTYTYAQNGTQTLVGGWDPTVNTSAGYNDMLDPAATPNASNWIVRAGELRSRPRQSQILPQLPDKSQITGHTAFADSNNVIHTCVVSTSGLWQLSANWKNAPTSPKKVWALVQKFSGANFPAPANPVQFQLFVNNLFFVNGSPNVWNWGGITPNAFTIKSALNSVAIYDTTHGMKMCIRDRSSGVFAGGFSNTPATPTFTPNMEDRKSVV